MLPSNVTKECLVAIAVNSKQPGVNAVSHGCIPLVTTLVNGVQIQLVAIRVNSRLAGASAVSHGCTQLATMPVLVDRGAATTIRPDRIQMVV